MPSNQGQSSLPKRRRRTNPMACYDALPKELRCWLSQAAIPWSPRSVRRAYSRFLAQTHSKEAALAELDRLQARQLERDATSVWVATSGKGA